MDATLPRTQRLRGKTAVAALFEGGKSAGAGCLRCKYLHRPTEEAPKILVSVPKRSFKRAVKRNLLKRRIRESYRRQKSLVPPGTDLIFIYASREVMPYEAIYADMTTLLTHLRFSQSTDNQEDTQSD